MLVSSTLSSSFILAEYSKISLILDADADAFVNVTSKLATTIKANKTCVM